MSCSLSAKVSFSPALTDSGGGTNPSTAKGTLSGCAPNNSAVTITKGTVTGSFASSPLSCLSNTTTGASPILNVVWKGTVDGIVGRTTYAGKAAFTATTVSGSSATGSFSGGATVAFGAPSNLATLCGAKKGIKSLTLAGTATVGTTPSTTVTCKRLADIDNGTYMVFSGCNGVKGFRSATTPWNSDNQLNQLTWNGGSVTVLHHETLTKLSSNFSCPGSYPRGEGDFVWAGQFTGTANWTDCDYAPKNDYPGAFDRLARSTVMTVTP